jgi:hypothetical protein
MRVGRPALATRCDSFAAAARSASAASSGLCVSIWAKSASWFECAASATTRKRSGCRLATSSVASPIVPVEPRMATPFMR